MYDDIMVKHLI